MTTITRQNVVINRTTNIPLSLPSTIEGSAIQVRGIPATYAKLGLTEAQAPTLLFTPDTYGLMAWTDEFARPGDTVVWPDGGTTFTIRDVGTIAPDGIVICARLVVSK
jgi:hypothetical protein